MGPKIYNSPLSIGIRLEADHQRRATQSQQSLNKQDAFLGMRGFCPDVTQSSCHRSDNCRSIWSVI